jgi:hypothetical protein
MRSISLSEVAPWVRSEILSPERDRPIVAVATRPSTGRFSIDPGVPEERFGEWADVVAIETGEAA